MAARESDLRGSSTAFLILFCLLSAAFELDGAPATLRKHAGLLSRRSDVDQPSFGAVLAPTVVGICESAVLDLGYPCNEFEVKTGDGYILSVQRIPQGRGGSDAGGDGKIRPPVLLQHGVLMDGLTWLLNSPDQSLAFVLADSGYDVWISNSRGTRYSRRHTTLDSSDPAFWVWSWDELVEYDLPATFNLVQRETGGQKINYVGHSMGTLIALASFAQGKLVDQLKSAALLSPIAYLSHMTTDIGLLAARAFVGEMVTWLGIAEFNPKGRAVQNFLRGLCANPGVDCFDMMSSFTGKNCCLNESTVETFLNFEPQSSSTKNMVHLAQTVRDGIIRKFDYGSHDMNIRYYGQGKPPIYNMSNIPNDLPLFLSYGGQDALSDVRDVELLLDNLKFHDGDKLTVQYIKDYAHADFVMGVTAKRIVYDAIVAFFNRQER